MSAIYCDKSLLPSRREDDFYPTDRATVRAALRAFAAHLQHEAHDSPRHPHPWMCMDPGAGAGVWGDVLRDVFPQCWLWGVEKGPIPPHPRYHVWLPKDFLVWEITVNQPATFDLVLGNPPYKDAEAFVRRALLWTHDGGHVLFLLRLAFLESVRRRDGLFRDHPIRKLWVCSRRPSFQPDGKSGPTAYAAYLWKKNWQGQTEVDYLGNA